jgi:hypothetical protein
MVPEGEGRRERDRGETSGFLLARTYKINTRDLTDGTVWYGGWLYASIECCRVIRNLEFQGWERVRRKIEA